MEKRCRCVVCRVNQTFPVRSYDDDESDSDADVHRPRKMLAEEDIERIFEYWDDDLCSGD